VRIFKAIENLNITAVVQTFKFYKDKFVKYESAQRSITEEKNRRIKILSDLAKAKYRKENPDFEEPNKIEILEMDEFDLRPDD
jgi:hypothetical protein